MSTDPALGEYVPEAGKGNAKDSANLPGMGGVYNVVNFNLYHYGSNNPVKYVDPDGNALHIVAGALIGAAVGGITAAVSGGSARQIAAAAVGGAVTGGLAAATGGMSLGAQIAGSAMAGTAGYCAEKLVSGEGGSVEGMVMAAAGGATGAMAGAVVSEVAPKVASAISKTVSGGSKIINNSTGNPVIDNIKQKVPNNEISAPAKRGNAPISIKDGKPIEIHHEGQNPNGSFKEMHPSDHRYGPNYKANHPNYNEDSLIDRAQFKKDVKDYWRNEWDKGRFE